MKKATLLLSIVAALLIFVTGCTVSKLMVDSKGNVEEEVKTAPEKKYVIREKDNINRVSLINHSSGDEEVEINFSRSTNVNVPENIRLKGSSGSTENSATYIGFRDIEFPFTGTLEYTIKPRLSESKIDGSKSGGGASNVSSDLRCRLSFIINEPGNWEVKVSN